MSNPSDRRYTADHEWIRVEGDVGTVGITHHAQVALGDIVHVDFPTVGATLKKGGGACTVESVKAVSEVYAPVSGTVTEVNEGLDGSEGSINEDPYGAGWLYRLRLSNPGELETLMDAATYTVHAGD
jgi:glycine cleavage system H protein